MGFFQLALLIAISSACAAAGLYIARHVLREQRLAAERQGAVSNGKESFENTAALGQTFLAVIELTTPKTARLDFIEDPKVQILRDHSDLIGSLLPDCQNQRIGSDTIECEFRASSKEDAVALLDAAVTQLAQSLDPEDLGFKPSHKAACSLLGQNPITQALVDKTAQALLAPIAADQTVIFVQPDAAKARNQSEIVTMRRLKEAIKNREVSLHYQPKYDVRGTSYRSAEALFRWNSPDAEDVSIAGLIESAERLHVIQDLTLWSLRQAVSDQLTLIENGQDITTFINMSAQLLADSEFCLQAIEIMKGAGGRIGLEITETAVIEHPGRALANLELYAATGAQIAIDDYGTGLSSLRYLKRIPAQELKIDREFIKELTQSNRDPMIVRSTIDLAHALDLKVTAEGVDDPMKLALLKVMGCDFLQGFHIAKPMPLAELIVFLADVELQNSIANPEISLLSKQAEQNAG